MRRILAIDGGGIKGVFPPRFLAAVEETLGLETAGRYFDLIVGTSTGGIIALGLGLEISGRDILAFYDGHGPAIFSGLLENSEGIVPGFDQNMILSHVVAFEGHAQLADVLGGEAGERHRQVEAQGYIATAVVGKPVELPLNLSLRTHLPEQDFRVFQRRSVDGDVAVGPINLARFLLQMLFQHHQLRQEIAEAL